MLLSGRNLSKRYGQRQLFNGITLGIDAGERIGLIGANGSGKSTLLKIFAGLEEPDDGELESRRNLRVEYVAQEESFAAGQTCMDAMLAAIDPSLDVHERETKAQVELGRAGLHDPRAEAAKLSGGWRKRLAIAAGLASARDEPDLLFLDEPTNHLDIEGIRWLEQMVSRIASRGSGAAVAFVTHDRTFLERVSTRVAELSPMYPSGLLVVDGELYESTGQRGESTVRRVDLEKGTVDRARPLARQLFG
ncbi:MAG: glutaminyl-peptide cyclotransferase, partial [Planctomycetota bacterium]